jgi:hypothetical protein
MQRLLLAIVAAILTTLGIVMVALNRPEYAGMSGLFLRSGLVLGALALALPQVLRMLEFAPPWFLGCLAIGFLVVIRWPKLFPLVLPALVVLWILGPRASATAAPAAKAKKPRARAKARRGT